MTQYEQLWNEFLIRTKIGVRRKQYISIALILVCIGIAVYGFVKNVTIGKVVGLFGLLVFMRPLMRVPQTATAYLRVMEGDLEALGGKEKVFEELNKIKPAREGLVGEHADLRYNEEWLAHLPEDGVAFFVRLKDLESVKPFHISNGRGMRHGVRVSYEDHRVIIDTDEKSAEILCGKLQSAVDRAKARHKDDLQPEE